MVRERKRWSDELQDEPEETRSSFDIAYDSSYERVSQMDDLDELEELVLHGGDVMDRAFAFSRLTGWAHWEDCDAFSHLTYSCEPVDGYSAERALHLCTEIQRQMGTCPPPYYPHEPMDIRDVLRDGAHMMNEQLRYGRFFASEASFVGWRAREEAATLGIDREGIEFWLLGILQFAQLEENDLRNTVFPFRNFRESVEDAASCRKELWLRDIRPARLERILRGVLVAGGQSDPELLPEYFDIAERLRSWDFDPIRATELLKAILARPTDTIRLALMRLALLMLLEERLPPELRPVQKTPYRPGMFTGQFELEEVDLSTIDLAGITDLQGMFEGCSSLREIDFSPLDTSQVTNMGSLLSGCSELRSIDLRTLDTSRVTNMESMFRSCKQLTSIDLSPLDMSRVTDMNRMFFYCPGLEEVNLRGINTAQVTDIEYLFWDCRSLRTADLSDLDLSRAKSVAGLFVGCSSLVHVELPRTGFPQANDLGYLFQDCSSLEEIDLSRLQAPRALNLSYLFAGCSALRTADLSNLVTPEAKFASRAFEGCTSLESFSIPETWPLNEKSTLPAPTAACEKWWSAAEGRWMSVEEILERGPMADTFTTAQVTR